MPGKLCAVERKNGERFCKLHGQKLLDRATYETVYGKLEQPAVGPVWICPVSKQMLSEMTAAHDAIQDHGIKLPEA